MTKEQIEAVALEAYPIDLQNQPVIVVDALYRSIWIDAATKVSELMGKAVSSSNPTIEAELDNIKYCPMESTPPVQEGVWNEAIDRYKYIGEGGVTYITFEFAEWLKKHYTLIKNS